MKKIITILIVTIMAFSTLCSCGSGEYKTPTQQAEETLSQILDCFVNNDVETLKGYFCPYIQDNVSDLDQKINDAFNLFDGKIVSYNDPFGSACGSSERKDTGATIENIKTDKGTEYSIAIKAWLTNNKEPEKIGVYVLVVKNETQMSNNGDSEEFKVRIKC